MSQGRGRWQSGQAGNACPRRIHRFLEPCLLHGQHEPGQVPGFIHSLGADVMLAGGMGGRAILFFQEYGIEGVTGADGTVRQSVERYLGGELKGAAPCKDSQEHGHSDIRPRVTRSRMSLAGYGKRRRPSAASWTRWPAGWADTDGNRAHIEKEKQSWVEEEAENKDKVVGAGAGVVRAVGRGAWVAQRPLARAVIASVPIAGTGSCTRSGSLVWTSSAPSAAQP